MPDHPIIFSAPMVRALLDGRKTQTRRLAYVQRMSRPGSAGYVRRKETVPSPWQRVKPRDRLWVRESLALGATSTAWKYAADDRLIALDWPDHRVAKMVEWSTARRTKSKSVPSIHMPRWASRLTLTVTAAKIERLQTLTIRDARAEGMPPIDVPVGFNNPSDADRAFLNQFAVLWDELHGPGSWDANPDVVALTFMVERRNIDAAPGP